MTRYAGQNPAQDSRARTWCRFEVRSALDEDISVSVYDGIASVSVEWRGSTGRAVRWFRTARQAIAWVKREGLRSEVSA